MKESQNEILELKKLGVEKEMAWISANMRNGNCYSGGYFVIQTVFNNKNLRDIYIKYLFNSLIITKILKYF